MHNGKLAAISDTCLRSRRRSQICSHPRLSGTPPTSAWVPRLRHQPCDGKAADELAEMVRQGQGAEECVTVAGDRTGDLSDSA